MQTQKRTADVPLVSSRPRKRAKVASQSQNTPTGSFWSLTSGPRMIMSAFKTAKGKFGKGLDPSQKEKEWPARPRDAHRQNAKETSHPQTSSNRNGTLPSHKLTTLNTSSFYSSAQRNPPLQFPFPSSSSPDKPSSSYSSAVLAKTTNRDIRARQIRSHTNNLIFPAQSIPTPPPSAPSELEAGPIPLTESKSYHPRPHIFQNRHAKSVRDKQRRVRERLGEQAEKSKKSRLLSDSTMPISSPLTRSRSNDEVTSKVGRLLGDTTTSESSLSRYRAMLQKANVGTSGYFDTRRHSSPDGYIQNAFDILYATLKQPKPPKPFSPRLEQLELRDRLKDLEIESRLRPKRIPLPDSLPPKDDAMVTSFLKKRGVVAKFGKEQVSDTDLCRLAPKQWLNDEIINFYGAMLLDRAEQMNKENHGVNGVNGLNGVANPGRGKGKVLNAHYFSSFFWTKLAKDGYERGRLAKWTKKLDIFSKDVLLIPVNHNNMHWTAAAVNFRAKRIESYDSMGNANAYVYKHLREYLDAEHRNKKGKPFNFDGWEDYRLEETPQQENGFDCGVFTCQFLESLSRGEENFAFVQEDIPYLRRRMIWEIGNTKFWPG